LCRLLREKRTDSCKFCRSFVANTYADRFRPRKAGLGGTVHVQERYLADYSSGVAFWSSPNDIIIRTRQQRWQSRRREAHFPTRDLWGQRAHLSHLSQHGDWNSISTRRTGPFHKQSARPSLPS